MHFLMILEGSLLFTLHCFLMKSLFVLVIKLFPSYLTPLFIPPGVFSVSMLSVLCVNVVKWPIGQ